MPPKKVRGFLPLCCFLPAYKLLAGHDNDREVMFVEMMEIQRWEGVETDLVWRLKERPNKEAVFKLRGEG